jgi:hypothetical protein
VLDAKSHHDQRTLDELLAYINQYQGNIDLLMCQMHYEPKVKETILFATVTTDILDRMNLILHSVRILAMKISIGDITNEQQRPKSTVDDVHQKNVPVRASYLIKVKTNDQVSASLSDEAIVTIKLFGILNKSSDIRLLKSIHKSKWQSGQIDLFNMELNYLGDVYAIKIWHDSEYSSWKVDWIDVIDDGANIFRFPIDRLFDRYSNEKTAHFIVQRDVGPVRRLPSKPIKTSKVYKPLGFSTYKIQVKTGKSPNKATDALIFIELKGDNGHFAGRTFAVRSNKFFIDTFLDNLCSANSAYQGTVFEPGQLDTFYVVWPNLATIHSLNVLIQSNGVNPVWFCEYIIVDDSQTQVQYKYISRDSIVLDRIERDVSCRFIVNQLFDSSNTDDRNAKKHLTVYPERTSNDRICMFVNRFVRKFCSMFRTSK